MAPRIPLDVRYERHINRTDDCWLWTGPVSSSGYPQFRIGRTNKTISVHRWTYERWVGPIPEGQLVLHRCDCKRCSNPAHLYCGTQTDNMRDMDERGRRVSNGGRPRKVTADQVNEALGDGLTVAQAALKLGVSEATIYRLRLTHPVDRG